MTIAIICTDRDPEPWVAALHECDPTLDIQVWPDERKKADVEFALCWKHPEGVLRDYPNLRCVSSMGAGIDHLLKDAFFPKHLPVVRLVDPLLAQGMFEYICTTVMYYFREFDIYQAQQRQFCWQQHFPRSVTKMIVGMMGLGQLGGYSAKRLATMGFDVIGWSRSQKVIPGVKAYAGEAQLDSFLCQADILICLLPLTDQTRGILNLELFSKLPKSACLVNVARGENLVEEDLLTALADGLLRGACLDVFREEPLPAEHPFWGHEKILITPHCSSVTDPRSVAPQIVQNYRLMRGSMPLLNQVDMLRGY
ncbi:MAG: glyoxylate/hydroxypyruvate reductase A [Proteobacteria bacterium]|nr:glyoxylate/hydroxypyruvate reductase A [Pseudomonadota bacterium]